MTTAAAMPNPRTIRLDGDRLSKRSRPADAAFCKSPTPQRANTRMNNDHDDSGLASGQAPAAGTRSPSTATLPADAPSGGGGFDPGPDAGSRQSGGADGSANDGGGGDGAATAAGGGRATPAATEKLKASATSRQARATVQVAARTRATDRPRGRGLPEIPARAAVVRTTTLPSRSSPSRAMSACPLPALASRAAAAHRGSTTNRASCTRSWPTQASARVARWRN